MSAASRTWLVVRSLAGAVVWYPPLLVGAWVLRLGTDAGVGLPDLMRSLVVGCSLAMVLALVSRSVFHDTPRSGAVAAIVVAGVLAVHSLVELLPFVAALGLLLVEARFAALGRLRLPWTRIHETVSVFAVVLVVIAGVQLAQNGQDHPSVRIDPAWESQIHTPSSRPNFYFILADGRGRSTCFGQCMDMTLFLSDFDPRGTGVPRAERQPRQLPVYRTLARFVLLGESPFGPGAGPCQTG